MARSEVLGGAIACALLLSACGDSQAAGAVDAGVADASVDAGSMPALPPVVAEAAARGFQLYYKERLHRVMLAYNRFGMFGDSHFATTIGRAAAARAGTEFEVVAGPKDNNLIGTAAFSAYYAYKLFRTRELELTLMRMLEGLVFYEEVPGVPGLTSRQVLPGWTRVMDGVAGTVTRTRLGEPIEHPSPPAAELEQEILSTFYDGVRFTYRENPAEYVFSFLPAASIVGYSITHSFDELPDYVRVSDCCSSLKRTPEGHKWEGAFWGNHNSRDNLPDLGMGFIAAMLTAGDSDASDELREVARRAVEAGNRIGDLIFENDGKLMTIDEHNPYETLTVGGDVRPHGMPENENLGAIAACPDSYLARAFSSEGLSLPAPDVPMPGTVEAVLAAAGVDCDVVPDRQCMGLADGYCGLEWSQFGDLTLGGMPLIPLIENLEAADPGRAESLLGSFQNDYDDIVEAMMAIVHYGFAVGDDEIVESARQITRDMSEIMRSNGDLIWQNSDPERQASQRYEAAVFDALAGAEVNEADLLDFAPEEERIVVLEALLDIEDTEPAALLTDEEIVDMVEASVTSLEADDRAWVSVRATRYRAEYGTEPPVRRAGDGYEARRAGGDWEPVETPRHTHFGNLDLVQALPICQTAPHLLDCRWAALGCARPDLNDDGTVDTRDLSSFDADFEVGRSCGAADAWCEGVDLDRSGSLDELDEAFMQAAEGCRYDP